MDEDGPRLDPNSRASTPNPDWPGIVYGAAVATAGSTPLMEASRQGNVEAVKLLLEAGAGGDRLKLTDSQGRSALHYATLAGASPDADAVAEVREQESDRSVSKTMRCSTEAAGCIQHPLAQSPSLQGTARIISSGP
eukprot:SAG31_NODE_273_length_18667_cov_3.603619_8_plen_137_part_00